LPVLGEPGPAKGVHDGGQWGEDLTPARLAAEADSRHPRLGAVDLRRDVGNLGPRRFRRHCNAFCREHILAIHQEGGLPVERLTVELSILRCQGGRHGRENVRLIERGVGRYVAVQWSDPFALGVNWYLEVAQSGNVVLPGLAGELLADLVSHVVLRQDGEVDRDAGVLGEVLRGELLKVDHLGVVDHQHADAVGSAAARATTPPGAPAHDQNQRGRHSGQG
jgi:hypothetical protein